MSSKLWRLTDERQTNRDLERAKAASDWAEMQSAFLGGLSRHGVAPDLSIRICKAEGLSRKAYPIEYSWWPKERVAEIERALQEADARDDVRGLHLHGGRPLPKVALDTVRLLDLAERAGPAVSLGMLVRAVLHFREARGWPPYEGFEFSRRAHWAINAIHPMLADLTWGPGAKDVLPIKIVANVKAGSLTSLGEVLADDAAALIAGWVPVRIQDPEYREQAIHC